LSEFTVHLYGNFFPLTQSEKGFINRKKCHKQFPDSNLPAIS